MVTMTGNYFPALYTPLSNTAESAGEFRLHADLHLPKCPVHVFDDVAADGTGASTFLRVSDFMRILRERGSRTPEPRSQIESLFGADLKADGFEKFFRLVHDKTYKWHCNCGTECDVR